MSQKEAVIEVQGVEHAYGHAESLEPVLFDNNLTLHRGEVVILTGPSGSGKTTLLTLIGALRSIQKGSIRFDGRELRGMSASDQIEIRKNIGFIFQTHNLFDSLTAAQNVLLVTELFRYTSKEAHRRTDEILGRLGLERYKHKKPNALSEGQRQRVAIGRALVNGPKLVLADEPTAALDREMGRLVVSLLRELATKEGTTVLMVTHDSRVLDEADRIVNMLDGQVVSATPNSRKAELL